jgi:hypothetical protein
MRANFVTAGIGLASILRLPRSRKALFVYPKPTASIRFAIRNCLARCRMTDAQLTCLSDFTQELWQAGWDRDSIRAVELGVMSALYGEQSVPSEGVPGDGIPSKVVPSDSGPLKTETA